MTTQREQITAALAALVDGATPSGMSVRRTNGRPEKVGLSGAAILDDGEVEEMGRELANDARHVDHSFGLTVMVQDVEADRIARIDSILEALGTAIENDRRLGGLVSSLRCDGVDIETEGDNGVQGIRVAEVQLVATYTAREYLR